MDVENNAEECKADFEAAVKIIDSLIDPPQHFKIGKSGCSNIDDVKVRYIPKLYKHWDHIIDTKYADSVEESLILHYRRTQQSSCDNEKAGGGEPGATFIYLAYNTLEDKVQEHLDNLSGHG